MELVFLEFGVHEAGVHHQLLIFTIEKSSKLQRDAHHPEFILQTPDVLIALLQSRKL